jgi:hypothetical protein
VEVVHIRFDVCYLTTAQTPQDGLRVDELYIYKAVSIAQEFYFAMSGDVSNVGMLI